MWLFGRIAQSVEQLPFKQTVGGSNPSAPTLFFLIFLGIRRVFLKSKLLCFLKNPGFGGGNEACAEGTTSDGGKGIPLRPHYFSYIYRIVYHFLLSFC